MTITDASRDEWIASRKPSNGFLREGSTRIYRSVEGTGIAPGIDAYPHQYLDIGFNQEPIPAWQEQAQTAARRARLYDLPLLRSHTAGNLKYPGFTPLGTSVATLTREGNDLLSSDCGYCGVNIGGCKCGQGASE